MIAHRTFKSAPVQTSPLYRCPGCDEIVDGGQLSEVLVHHQHVLDSYRLTVMQRLNAARTKQRANDAEELIGVSRLSAVGN